ncbi:MAG: SCO family protein [Thermoanaerobaculia bacterium]
MRLLAPTLLLAAALLAGLAACRPREPLPVLAELPEFSLIERSGTPLDKAALAGRPAIVDFIFTRCPASCPRLTARMKELERRIPESSTVRLLSITVDPEHDRPAELTSYAEGWQAGPRWLFATGERAAIWELIRKGFLLAVEATPEDTTSPILHSNRFALVDGQGRLRATYIAFEEDALDRVLADLAAVEAEGGKR